MKINEFFLRRLRVPLYHHVWSWGAVDRKANRVFLRVNEDSVVKDDDRKEWVIVYDPDWKPSAGHGERRKHIDALRHGASGFAVTVRFNDSGKIASFNHETLLILGKVVEKDGLTFAQVIGRRPVEEIVDSDSEFSSTSGDMERILKSEVTKTERQALIDARLGQGAFRSVVLSRWDYRCAVTGVSVAAAIRASHIKPWKVSSNAERLDPFNGLPLVATLDALFDAGLLSFERTGKILLSSELSAEDKKLLGVRTLRLRKVPSKPTSAYIEYHRRHRFHS